MVVAFEKDLWAINFLGGCYVMPAAPPALLLKTGLEAIEILSRRASATIRQISCRDASGDL